MFIYTASAQYFSVSPPNKNIDVTFDESPKGDRANWQNPYIEYFEITVTNNLNTTLSVDVNTDSSSYYIRLESLESSLNILALDSGSVKIKVKIIDSAPEGQYSGWVKLVSGSQTTYVNVYVNAHWPPPTLSISGNLDFGDVKAGKSYEGYFILKEILKFKDATNVKVSLNEGSAIYGVSISPSVIPYVGSQEIPITFSFTVKEWGLVPNTYTSDFSVFSTNGAVVKGSKSLRYIIPKPTVEVSMPQNEMIFDYNKSENKNQRITISETGGYTPLENTKISFKKLIKEFKEVKEPYKADWFNFPTTPIGISPGSSSTIDIEVRKPKGAPIGRYTWEGDVKTTYAETSFSFYFVVIPPCLEESKNILTKFKEELLVIKYSQAENLIKTTDSLLNKEENGLKDTENVCSMANVVIKFSNSTSVAYAQYEKNSYNEAYEAFRASKEEKDELNSIKLKQIYSQENNEINNSANNVWKEIALLLRNGLEQYGNRLESPSLPDASYAGAKEAHKKIVDICEWVGDTSCIQAHNSKIEKLDNDIKKLLLEANELEIEVNTIYEGISNNTWSFLGIKLIKNPSKILYFLENYKKIIANYDVISTNYRLSGEQKGLEKSQENQTMVKREYENFRLINTLYIVFLGFITSLTIQKSIQGLLKYRADAKDVKLAEIARLKRII